MFSVARTLRASKALPLRNATVSATVLLIARYTLAA